MKTVVPSAHLFMPVCPACFQAAFLVAGPFCQQKSACSTLHFSRAHFLTPLERAMMLRQCCSFC